MSILQNSFQPDKRHRVYIYVVNLILSIRKQTVLIAKKFENLLSTFKYCWHCSKIDGMTIHNKTSKFLEQTRLIKQWRSQSTMSFHPYTFRTPFASLQNWNTWLELYFGINHENNFRCPIVFFFLFLFFNSLTEIPNKLTGSKSFKES